MPATSKLSLFWKRRALVVTSILFSLSGGIFASPYVWPTLIAGPTADQAISTTTIAYRDQIQSSRVAEHEDEQTIVGAWFLADRKAMEQSKEQVLSIEVQYPRSMRLNETPTVDFTLAAKEGSYSRNLFIKLSSAGFKIDPESPLELNSNVLPVHRSWTISPNSEGKHTLVLTVSKPAAVGFASLNDTPVRPEETFKLPITVYAIYGIPLWMVNSLGALAALGGTAVAWGPFAAWLYQKKSPIRLPNGF